MEKKTSSAQADTASFSQLREENAALKQENEELRRKLERMHIPDQTRQLHGENPPVRRRKSASPPEVSASNRLCQPQGLAERKISRRTRG